MILANKIDHPTLDEEPQNPAVGSKADTGEELFMHEPESSQEAMHQEPLPSSRDNPPADEREKLAADWNAYTPETLLALDG
jgi:hypothetical protein